MNYYIKYEFKYKYRPPLITDDYSASIYETTEDLTKERIVYAKISKDEYGKLYTTSKWISCSPSHITRYSEHYIVSILTPEEFKREVFIESL